MLKCIEKLRDGNGIIRIYRIMDTKTNNVKEISAVELKRLISTGTVTISNLKLTSDYRLIDKNEGYEQPKPSGTPVVNINSQGKFTREAVASEYYKDCDRNQVNYAIAKTKSKRLGRHIAKALVLGLTCVTLGTSLTGCGTTNVNALESQPAIMTEAETQSLSIHDIVNEINSAKTIYLDIKNISFNDKATIKLDNSDEEIATIQGKTFKIFDSVSLKTDAGDLNIVTSEDYDLLMRDTWAIRDEDGVIKYGIQEKILSIGTCYWIYDANGNKVGEIKQKIFKVANHSAYVYDMDNNLIATIKQNPLRRDFEVVVEDGCTIDNMSLIAMSFNYINHCYDQDVENSKSNSNSNNNSSKSSGSSYNY